MPSQGTEQGETVFCHACENEWLKEAHGLECPDCHSDVVEIIDEHHDPRDNHITISDDDDDDDINETANSSHDHLPPHPLHHHNPWQGDPPDPDEGNIEHVEWNPAPGVHFTRTLYRTTVPGGMGSRQPGPGAIRNSGPLPQDNRTFAPSFQDLSSMLFQGVANAQRPTPGSPREHQPRSPPTAQHNGHFHSPGLPSRNSSSDHHHHADPHHGHIPFSPVNPNTGRGVFTTGPIPLNGNGDALQTVLATLLQSMQAGMMHQAGSQPNGMHAFLSSLMGNGAHGDAVYTEEALDRIVSQLMEQTSGHAGPGPASAAAIAALPKKKVDQSMMGENGKAECSVCIDAVQIGDEVTILPCKHWFHDECVGAWLKEHDTCPHCRRGIMPKDAPVDIDTPRSPDQPPSHDQNNNPSFNRGPPPFPQGQQPPFHTAFFQPGIQQPYVPGGFPNYPEPQNYVIPPNMQQQDHRFSPQSPSSPHQNPNDHARRRRSSARSRSGGNDSEGSGGGQGVTAWFRNLRGSSS